MQQFAVEIQAQQVSAVKTHPTSPPKASSTPNNANRELQQQCKQPNSRNLRHRQPCCLASNAASAV